MKPIFEKIEFFELCDEYDWLEQEGRPLFCLTFKTDFAFILFVNPSCRCMLITFKGEHYRRRKPR